MEQLIAAAAAADPQRVHMRIRADWADAAGYRPDRMPQGAASVAALPPSMRPRSGQNSRSVANPKHPMSARSATEESKQEMRFQTAIPSPRPPAGAFIPALPIPVGAFPFPPPPVLALTQGGLAFPPPPIIPLSPTHAPNLLRPAFIPHLEASSPAGMFLLGSLEERQKQREAEERKEKERKERKAREAAIKFTSFVPFKHNQQIMSATQSSAHHIRSSDSPVVPAKGNTFSQTQSSPKPRVRQIRAHQLYSHLPPALQTTPYAPLVAQSTPPGSKDPAHPSNNPVNVLPLPEGLLEGGSGLEQWEVEMLKHLAKYAGAFFDKSLSTLLHPTPLELLFFLEHYRQSGILFGELEEAVRACQAEKDRVRFFVNHKEKARGLLGEWSDGSFEQEKVSRPPSRAAGAEDSSPDNQYLLIEPLEDLQPPPSELFVERVDAIDLTLLFEQTRCGGNLALHLRHLQSRRRTFQTMLQLTSALMDEEKEFQSRLGELFTFMNSPSCLLFPSSLRSTCCNRSSLHSLLKSLTKRGQEEILVRCVSWNEEVKEQKRKREASMPPRSPRTGSKPMSPRGERKQKDPSTKKNKHADVQSKVALAWQPAVELKAPEQAEEARIKVFRSMEELVAVLKKEESTPPSLLPVQLSTFLLGREGLIGHVEELMLEDLEQIEGVLDEPKGQEEEEAKTPSSGTQQQPKVSPPSSNDVISKHEQLLFHLQVLAEEHAVTKRAAAASHTSTSPSSHSTAFTSLHTLLAGVRSEADTAAKRRQQVKEWMVEESELFAVSETRNELGTGPQQYPFMMGNPYLQMQPVPAPAPLSDCILSDANLSKLYFRCPSAGGSRLLYQVKQLVWNAVPSPSSTWQQRGEYCLQREDDHPPVYVSPANLGFEWVEDIDKLIGEVEKQYRILQQQAEELHAFITQPNCLLLTSSLRSYFTLDSSLSLLLFSETSSHTLSYIQKWSRQIRDAQVGRGAEEEEEMEGKEEGEVMHTKPFESTDDLVDALIQHHVLIVKRNLVQHLEHHFASMCPSLSALTDLELERIMSLTRSTEQLKMVLALVDRIESRPMEQSNTAGSVARAKEDRERAIWRDADESVPTLYATLDDFLAELRFLANKLQYSLDSAFSFLTSPTECCLWMGDFATDLMREVKDEPEALLRLFKGVGMEAVAQLKRMNTTHAGKFVSLSQLHSALVTAHTEHQASLQPGRALLREFLSSPHTFLLRPYFALKLQRQLEQRAAEKPHSSKQVILDARANGAAWPCQCRWRRTQGVEPHREGVELRHRRFWMSRERRQPPRLATLVLQPSEVRPLRRMLHFPSLSAR